MTLSKAQIFAASMSSDELETSTTNKSAKAKTSLYLYNVTTMTFSGNNQIMTVIDL